MIFLPLGINIFELLSATVSLISFILGVKQRPIVWVISIFTTILNIFLYHNVGLYHRWVLNIGSVLISIYGYYKWSKKTDNRSFRVSKTNYKEYFELIIIGMVLSIMLFFILKLIQQKGLILSSIRTAFTFIGIYMSAKKKLESYLLWFVLNIISLYLAYIGGLKLFAIKYGISMLLSLYGYKKWKDSMRVS